MCRCPTILAEELEGYQDAADLLAELMAPALLPFLTPRAYGKDHLQRSLVVVKCAFGVGDVSIFGIAARSADTVGEQWVMFWNFGFDAPFLPDLQQVEEDRDWCCFFLMARCRIFSAHTGTPPLARLSPAKAWAYRYRAKRR
jgi:hypothetical protein